MAITPIWSISCLRCRPSRRASSTSPAAGAPAWHMAREPRRRRAHHAHLYKCRVIGQHHLRRHIQGRARRHRPGPGRSARQHPVQAACTSLSPRRHAHGARRSTRSTSTTTLCSQRRRVPGSRRHRPRIVLGAPRARHPAFIDAFLAATTSGLADPRRESGGWRRAGRPAPPARITRSRTLGHRYSAHPRPARRRTQSRRRPARGRVRKTSKHSRCPMSPRRDPQSLSELGSARPLRDLAPPAGEGGARHYRALRQAGPSARHLLMPMSICWTAVRTARRAGCGATLSRTGGAPAFRWPSAAKSPQPGTPMGITTWSIRSSRRWRIFHSDHPADRRTGGGPAWHRDMTRAQPHGRIAAGEPARLILFAARTLNELLRRGRKRTGSSPTRPRARANACRTMRSWTR